MNDAELAALALVIADSIERERQDASAGVIRQLARRVVELGSERPTGPDACQGCGAALSQPHTGRPRKWCGRGRCDWRTRENAKVAS
jgi:hypothetical protein